MLEGIPGKCQWREVKLEGFSSHPQYTCTAVMNSWGSFCQEHPNFDPDGGKRQGKRSHSSLVLRAAVFILCISDVCLTQNSWYFIHLNTLSQIIILISLTPHNIQYSNILLSVICTISTTQIIFVSCYKQTVLVLSEQSGEGSCWFMSAVL